MKAFKAFLYGVKFVIPTDHHPFVYMQRRKLVYSRIARTVERNVLTDMMSRMPGAEHLDIPVVKDVEYLPEGIM